MGDHTIAGRLALTDVMVDLADQRPVFHSEADFQFAFAQTVTQKDPGIGCRLEVPQNAIESTSSRRGEYLDLACHSPDGTTLIEFKYATRGWTGTDHHGEVFRLRHHAAYDLTRRYYIHDIRRLERFIARADNINGLAILLTNEPSLWAPAASKKRTRFENFRIHDGQTLSDTMVWGYGDAPKYDITLDGVYDLTWYDYSTHTDADVALRWLAVEAIPGGAHDADPENGQAADPLGALPDTGPPQQHDRSR